MLLSFMRHLIMRWPRNCVDSLVTLAHVSAKECSLPFFIVKRTEIYSDVRFLLIKPAYHTGYSERWSVKRLRIFQCCIFFVSRPGPAALRDTNLKMTSDEHVKVSASSCKLSSPTNFDNCKLLSLKSFSFLIQIFRFSLQE